jgi:hypothetical protein
MLALNLGVLLVSCGLGYAWFVAFRVVRLRQDLFDVRDWLFDRATILEGGLADPAYKQAREHLNAMANIADSLSIPVVMYCWSRFDGESFDWIKTENASLQRDIDAAVDRAAERIFRYLERETFRGWIFSAAMVCSQARDWERRAILSVLNRLIRSESAFAIESVGEHSGLARA